MCAAVLSPQSLSSLLVRAQRHADRAALEKVLAAHKRYVAWFCARATLRPEEVEDVSQDVALRLLQPSRYQPYDAARGTVRQYLHGHILNAIRDRLAVRMPVASADALADSASDLDATDEWHPRAAPDAAWDRIELVERLRATVSCPPRAWVVVHHRFWGHLGHDEIAALIGVSPDTVRRDLRAFVAAARATLAA